MNFDAGTAQGNEKVITIDLLTKGEAQYFQALGQRRDGVVADRRDPPVSEIDNGQRLEYIVELGGVKSILSSCLPRTRAECSK